MPKYSVRRPRGAVVLVANDKGDAVCTVKISDTDGEELGELTVRDNLYSLKCSPGFVSVVAPGHSAALGAAKLFVQALDELVKKEGA